MNALDTALQHLAAAASALEHTSQPTLKDIKESRDKAKAAHQILDASTKLLGYGIYTVTQEPGADTPLFQADGQPAAGVHTPEPAPEPISWAIPTEQEVIAHQRKLDLASGE